jgi:hypothetical protein
MTIASFNDSIHNRGRNFFRPFFHLWRKIARRGACGIERPIDLWEENPGFLQEALLAVRMAANPGDDYEDAVATIEKEAAKYQEYQRKPVPIGKISLNAKRLSREAGETAPLGRMYQVRNPAEGQACVLYTFDRSDSLVLEFIVHDKHDNPLFPIVRTYSNWLGKRKFHLGPDHTFHLKMTEGATPELVRVQASFSSNEADEPNVCEAATFGERRPPFTARSADGNDDWEPLTSTFRQLCRNRVASLLFAQGLVVLLILCGVLWQLTPRHPQAGGRSYAAEPHLHRTAVVLALNEDDVKLLFGGERVGQLKKRGTVADATMAREKFWQRVNFVAPVSRSSTAETGDNNTVNPAFCTDGIRCDELNASLKFALDSMRSFLAQHVGKAAAVASPRADTPIMTDAPSNGCTDGMRVTLLPYNNLMLVSEQGCSEYDGGQADSLAKNSDEVMFSQLTPDIRNTEELLNSQGQGEPEGNR